MAIWNIHNKRLQLLPTMQLRMLGRTTTTPRRTSSQHVLHMRRATTRTSSVLDAVSGPKYLALWIIGYQRIQLLPPM